MRRLLGGLLRTYLAAYFETGASVDELGVLGDDLVLQHLSLRADVLSALLPAGLPLRFASGYVRELRIQHETRRVEWRETAGELGAMLLHARLVQQMQPVLNRRISRKRQQLELE